MGETDWAGGADGAEREAEQRRWEGTQAGDAGRESRSWEAPECRGQECPGGEAEVEGATGRCDGKDRRETPSPEKGRDLRQHTGAEGGAGMPSGVLEPAAELGAQKDKGRQRGGWMDAGRTDEQMAQACGETGPKRRPDLQCISWGSEPPLLAWVGPPTPPGCNAEACLSGRAETPRSLSF